MHLLQLIYLHVVNTCTSLQFVYSIEFAIYLLDKIMCELFFDAVEVQRSPGFQRSISNADRGLLYSKKQ